MNLIGSRAYGAALTSYIATIPLKDLGASGDKLPLFIIPKGETIVAVKLVCTEDSNGVGSFNVGTYKIAADGTVGEVTGTDANKALYSGASYAKDVYDAEGKLTTAGTKIGALITKQSTAIGTQAAEDMVVQATVATATTAATKGAFLLEMVTL